MQDMTREQHLVLYRSYAKQLREWPVERCDVEIAVPPGMSKGLKHAHWMVHEMLRKLESQEDLPGQADRWLGFIQAIFWTNGMCSINELRAQVTASHR